MGFIPYNPNPLKKITGDCVIRAISKVTDEDWDTTYINVMLKGFELKDMPSANYVWGSYLKSIGFDKFTIPNTCPDCYTIREFCTDNPKGSFIIATGSHVVAIIDGNYYDSWDSGNEVPMYYFKRRVSD